MKKVLCKASLLDGYRIPWFRILWFRTRARIKQHDRDPIASVITLTRSQKTACDGCATNPKLR
jgi:hypothetical protein